MKTVRRMFMVSALMIPLVLSTQTTANPPSTGIIGSIFRYAAQNRFIGGLTKLLLVGNRTELAPGTPITKFERCPQRNFFGNKSPCTVSMGTEIKKTTLGWWPFRLNLFETDRETPICKRGKPVSLACAGCPGLKKLLDTETVKNPSWLGGKIAKLLGYTIEEKKKKA
ncbi:MAG: hypothetical protein M1549_02760 [Candidatus Dependentiae bacterium]|nr:hypothetical protein [Candidatus Dependentiae bacterium]